MINSTQNTALKISFAASCVIALALSPFALAQEHQHGKEKSDAAAEKSVTGEIVDMMCYVDHNAVGESHGQSCGAKCIKNGGPVGIVSDRKAELVVGEHKPIKDQHAEYRGKTNTHKSKP